MAKVENTFSFEISLSVLNHLGRNLYRSFMTVLGEAISNAWDADAENVWIYIDRDNNSFVIKDDGEGMNADDFQNKFLKIGYSKRKDGSTLTQKNRPFIGRKGIGKLALLSCADKISIQTKTSDGEYVGGVIDNSGLDEAIKSDLNPDQYKLGEVTNEYFEKYKINHTHGTIIYFENTKDGIKNSINYLEKLIALYFRFSLLDNSFNIFVNDNKITLDFLQDLASKTQFLWNIDGFDDPYIKELLEPTVLENRVLRSDSDFRGFLASVDKPRDLRVITTDEKLGVDLFVNGRLRERDILRHIPTARLVESYLYGQIHFNTLDDEKDRFTSSREGVIADDEKFNQLLDSLRTRIMPEVIEDWDKWRIKHRKGGDPENDRISRKERTARDLFNAVSDDYSLPNGSQQKEKIDGWVDELADDAQFNFSSYAECFISENLLRKFLTEKRSPLTTVQSVIEDFRRREIENKAAGNINIEIRQRADDLSYLDMSNLARIVEPQRGTTNAITIDAKEYRPIRDALAHTALLTNEAKQKLTTVYANIKGRVRTLLSTP